MSIELNLRSLAERWRDADAGERANAQLYLTELTEALDVPRPQPKGSGYEFELRIHVVNRDGTESVEFADLHKEGCFLLEAKHEDPEKSNELLLRSAYGQARSYVTHVPGAPPPYILVLDVGRTLIVWDRWSGTYGGFQAGRKIDLRALADRPQDIALLRDIWLDPQARDPRRKANLVTKEIAGKLARLAATLEGRGHDQEVVARFLIRCVFTMFAEDVSLLRDEPFLRIVEGIGMEDPEKFAEALERLWAAMDAGEWFGPQKILYFNGHFFRDHTVVLLTREDLGILLEAARADWQFVEPAIFGTLLTRALDPEERHRLGAEFTPREFVERLVRPTIEEPIRDRWTVVEAEVIQLLENGSKRARRSAVRRLNRFHAWLRSLKILDPACGSGNFLYVALEKLKEIESEVIRTIEQITGEPDLQVEEVNPSQFHGIEIKPWAREIAELTLWIGYHQYWIAEHGHARPPEPVLEDTHTFECRDAVLAWDGIQVDPARARPDPEPSEVHPVTGESVPSPTATLPYEVYENARPAEWPRAHFIVGNPPYMGRWRQREEFGDGYVEALRGAYPEVPEDADYVMYWWYKAAQEVASGRTLRAGLITTNTIRQKQQRIVIDRAREKGAALIWAVPDHPWVDEAGSAAVRVSMTVLAARKNGARLIEVNDEAAVVRELEAEEINSDLTVRIDVATAAQQPLLANEGISSQGFTLVGQGFVLDGAKARKLLGESLDSHPIVRPYRSGFDITRRPRDQYVIDFGLMESEEAKVKHPVLWNIVNDRVRPMREVNRDPSTKKYWWRFGRNRKDLREALDVLPRYIATSETSKHRFFLFLPAREACSHAAVVIALDDPFFLGVLSSGIHVAWSLAAGGRLGYGNDPRYQKALCFDAFPFPEPDNGLRQEIGALAERIDQHRKDALDRNSELTMTGIYNVVEALLEGTRLTEGERQIHESAACGVLLVLHAELDRLIAKAYGWPWPLEGEEILERLVALHAERAAEEARGLVRWLRPDFQESKYGHRIEAEAPELALEEEEAAEVEAERPPWPSGAVEQIAAVKEALAEAPGSVEEVASRFHNATRRLVQRHLDTLAIMGEARRTEDGRFHPVTGPPEAYAA